MEFEAVGRIPVSHFRLEVRRQVDDVDGTKGAFFGADPTSNAKAFRDEGNFRLGRDFDAQLASSDYWAGLLALLTAFLWRILITAIDAGKGHLSQPLVCTDEAKYGLVSFWSFC